MAVNDLAGAKAPLEPIELDYLAHSLLWGVRVMAIGRGDCPALRMMFVDLCGNAADEVLNVLFVLIKQLALRGRRRLRLHAPGCQGINSDELMLLSAIAAAQASGDQRGDERIWLSSLIGAEADTAVSSTVSWFAQLLAANGQRLCIDQLPSSMMEAETGNPTSKMVH